MKKYIIILIALCIVSIQANARNNISQSRNKKPDKVENRSFSDVKEVEIEHSFGNIIIQESSGNKASLEIRYFQDKKQVPKSTVNFSRNKLSIKTKNNGKKDSSIDYILCLPKNTNVNVELKYGNIKIEKISGTLNIKAEYSNINGTLIQGKLTTIKGNFNNIKMGSLKNMNMSCDYSEVKIDKSNDLLLKSKYTNYNINATRSILKGSFSEFGNVKIGEVSSIEDINLKFSDLRIKKLNKFLKADCNYSDTKISLVYKDFKSINIKSSFSDIKLELHRNCLTKIDLKNTFGDIKIKNSLSAKYYDMGEKNNVKTRKGTIGKEKPTSEISITNSYSDIIIN